MNTQHRDQETGNARPRRSPLETWWRARGLTRPELAGVIVRDSNHFGQDQPQAAAYVAGLEAGLIEPALVPVVFAQSIPREVLLEQRRWFEQFEKRGAA